jgi:hypothetical protein
MRRVRLSVEVQSDEWFSCAIRSVHNRTEQQRNSRHRVSRNEASGPGSLSSQCLWPAAYAPHPPRSGPPSSGAT